MIRYNVEDIEEAINFRCFETLLHILLNSAHPNLSEKAAVTLNSLPINKSTKIKMTKLINVSFLTNILDKTNSYKIRVRVAVILSNLSNNALIHFDLLNAQIIPIVKRCLNDNTEDANLALPLISIITNLSYNKNYYLRLLAANLHPTLSQLKNNLEPKEGVIDQIDSLLNKLPPPQQQNSFESITAFFKQHQDKPNSFFDLSPKELIEQTDKCLFLIKSGFSL